MPEFLNKILQFLQDELFNVAGFSVKGVLRCYSGGSFNLGNNYYLRVCRQ